MSARSARALVAVVHTSGLTKDAYAALFAELAPDLEVAHFVDESLLDDWRRLGGPDESLVARVRALVGEAMAVSPTLVLSQCSSIGDVVAEIAASCPIPILRVDEPMVERAVEAGRRIGVVATLATTLGPTRRLVEAIARAREQVVEVEILLVPDAFDWLTAGELARHDAAVAEAIRGLATGVDVILCAQGSMAPAASGLGDLGKPIWTSPRLGVARAVERVRGSAPSD